MARRQPDLFLFVGDTVYADQLCGQRPHVPGADYVATTLAEFHGKHRYNRADPALQEFFRTTSVFAIWDDHEVRNNFAGPTEPLMPVGLQALLDYWPIQGPPEEPRRLYRARPLGTPPRGIHPRHPPVPEPERRGRRSGQDDARRGAAGVAAPRARGLRRDVEARRHERAARHVHGRPLLRLMVGREPLRLSALRPDRVRARARRDPRRPSAITASATWCSWRATSTTPSCCATSRRRDSSVHEFIAGPLAARQGYPRFLDRSLNSRSLGSLGFTPNFGELAGGRLNAARADVRRVRCRSGCRCASAPAASSPSAERARRRGNAAPAASAARAHDTQHRRRDLDDAQGRRRGERRRGRRPLRFPGPRQAPRRVAHRATVSLGAPERVVRDARRDPRRLRWRTSHLARPVGDRAAGGASTRDEDEERRHDDRAGTRGDPRETAAGPHRLRARRRR